MHSDIEKTIRSRIVELQDETGCWNVLAQGDKYYPHLNYYVPNFKSTLWTLVLLADIETNYRDNDFQRPLKVISDHFYDRRANIYSIGKSHFPIPCLNGNMVYLHSYFHSGNDGTMNDIIDFFNEYQRFDDGDFKTPSSFPYYANHSCYGKHSCYWGVVKLLKGLSFIPKSRRSKNAKKLIKNCIDFVLLHKVCYSSHDSSNYIQRNIQYLTFPNMWQADFLEILWILKREQVKSARMKGALDFLMSKRSPESTWKMERSIKNLIVPVGKTSYGNELVTRRAREVSKYYQLI